MSPRYCSRLVIVLDMIIDIVTMNLACVGFSLSDAQVWPVQQLNRPYHTAS
jgi:hypothetical protein